MMVTLGGQDFSIEFNHGVNARIGEYTECVIFVLGDGPKAVDRRGIVTRHHADRPNRVIARRAALTKALASLPPRRAPRLLVRL